MVPTLCYSLLCMSIAMSLFCRHCSDGHELLLLLSACGRVGTSTNHCSDASIPMLVINFDVWTSSIDEQVIMVTETEGHVWP
jgi:hypothetical protein